ncbi:uncharacterized protein LOC128553294 [Mercenaria mercenaria]|uniref:uncharacterized protein LOC128553294 n=1 Tax=Mercenaria mercenaria TaxID=6596 RepID=UPI00234EE36B|nr:uncharacterized protein LOC128553294 [Mercenaria mercenaria]
MTGLHKEIELHMQIPGHSRCLIDAGFANFKRLYRVVYDRPGMVFVKKTPDGEERSFSITRDQSTVFVANHLPEVLTAGGLLIEMQRYLSIRPYVRQLAKDETCPLPNNEE